MAERVVVDLEPVQIEDPDGDCLLSAKAAQRALHVGEQLAPVPEAGEHIGHGHVIAAAPCQHQAPEDDRECCQKERDRQHRPIGRYRSRPDSLPSKLEIGRGKRRVQLRCDATRLLALAELHGRRDRVAVRNHDRELVSECVVLFRQESDFRRRVAVLDLSEGGDRSIKPFLRHLDEAPSSPRASPVGPRRRLPR